MIIKIKKNKNNPNFDVWHVVFCLMGIICGMMIMCLYIYYFEIAFLNHIRIENLQIGLNESKLIDLIYQKVQ